MDKLKTSRLYILIFILICIGLNISGDYVSYRLRLPFYFDTFGTLLAAALGGYVPGVVTGAASFILIAIRFPVLQYFSFIGVSVAVLCAYLSYSGIFKNIKKIFVWIPVLAVLSGFVRAVLQWFLLTDHKALFPLSAFCTFINSHTILSEFFSLAVADYTIALLEITFSLIIICLIFDKCPAFLLRFFPLGQFYGKDNGKKQPDTSELAAPSLDIKKTIKGKFCFLIIAANMTIAFFSIFASIELYKKNIIRNTRDTAVASLNWVESLLNAKDVENWINFHSVNDESSAERKKLLKIVTTQPTVGRLYICSRNKVLFDSAGKTEQGTEPERICNETGDFPLPDGARTSYNETRIAAVPESESQLITYYRPVVDENGFQYAVVYVEVSARFIDSRIVRYSVRIIALLGALIMLTTVIILQITEETTVRPARELIAAIRNFAYARDDDRSSNSESLHRLDIDTGDEIEALYHAVIKTTDDFSRYMKEISSKNAVLELQTRHISSLQDSIILNLAMLVESRDNNTSMHIQRTSNYVKLLAEELYREGLYPAELTDDFCVRIAKSSPLHDIGKIIIPDAVLNKPGRLTPDEFTIIQQHAPRGAVILENMLGDQYRNSSLSEAVDMAAFHHERWDGHGYPSGLSKYEIPLSARIMAVADVFDALRSKRSYKEGFTLETTMDIMLKESGFHFDPVIIKALKILIDEKKIT
ncbi:MAG: HD domain-containing protein [Treponema sp.]|nr:HD domain-containing protein [Treponema sp.]